MKCVQCGVAFEDRTGFRPRIRCFSCSPINQTSSPTRKKCSVCGKTFVTGKSFKTTCSNDCSKAKGRASCRDYWYRVRATHINRVEIPCRNPKCGKLFVIGLRKFYCSRECKVTHRNILRPGASLRRRIKKYGCASEPVNHLLVFERDRWLCGICGKRTVKSRVGTTHSRAPTLDHVIPLSKGGSHSYANVQCAHRFCNISKGND